MSPYCRVRDIEHSRARPNLRARGVVLIRQANESVEKSRRDICALGGPEFETFCGDAKR